MLLQLTVWFKQSATLWSFTGSHYAGSGKPAVGFFLPLPFPFFGLSDPAASSGAFSSFFFVFDFLLFVTGTISIAF